MNDPLIEQLLAARRGGPKLPDMAESDLPRARILAVQAGVAARLGPVGGFKAFCPPGQPIGVAPIFARDIHESPATLTIPADEEIGVELEYAFRLLAPLPPADAADHAARLRDSVELLPAFELVQSRLANPGRAGAGLKMLDNQLNGAVVLGPACRDWQRIDVTRATAHLAVNGRTLLDGPAPVPGGDAFATLCGFARALGPHCGGLRPGQVVITGSLNGLPWFAPPVSARGGIEGLGDVAMSLAPP